MQRDCEQKPGAMQLLSAGEVAKMHGARLLFAILLHRFMPS